MRLGRRPEPRIESLETHPKRHVCLRVAAEYLEVDVRTLGKWIHQGLIVAVPYGKHRRIPIEALRTFHDEHNAA
jgi:excisionase family DNA binding protein